MRRIVTSTAYSALLDAGRAFLADHAGKTEVVVVGSTRAAAQEFVRGTGEAGALGVHALTLNQLASAIGGPAMGAFGLAPLTRLGAEAVAARAAHRAIQEGKLQYFGPVATMPGFARAVASTLTELRLQQVGGRDLKKAAKPGADLALLFDLFDQQLEERGLADLADILALATAEVARHRLRGLPLLLLDLPLDFKAQREFVQELAKHSPAVLILSLEGSECNLSGFDETRTVADTCTTPLDRVRRYLFSADAPEDAASGDGLIFSAPGEGLECVEIARRIRELAATGTPFDRIAILLRDPVRYQPLMEDALRRASIPEYFSRGTARPDPAGRAFLALLQCAGEGCTATRFAEYLSLGQVPTPDPSGAPPQPPRIFVPPNDELVPSLPGSELDAQDSQSLTPSFELAAPANWEKLLVDASVIGGYDRWERRLDGLEKELRQKLTETQRDDDPTGAGIERQLSHLGNLKRFALPLIEYLHSLPVAENWGVWIDRLSTLAGMSLRWPEPVLAVLAELQPMSDVGPVQLDEVYGVLADRLGTLRNEPPRRRYGRVFVGSIEEARGRMFDVVFLPGLAEGVFPKRAFEDPLLLDDRRELVSADLGRRRDRDVRERLLLRIAAAAAKVSLVVSYPRVNVEQSRPRVPSFYALEVLRAAEGRLPNLREFEKRAASGSPTRLDWPAPKDPSQAIDNAEYDLAWLKMSENRKGSGRYLIDASKPLAESLRTRWKRWDRRKWWDGDGIVDADQATLAGLAAHRLRARSYSPSSLQQFASCPYKFLLYAVLQLRKREESVALEQMDPLTRGALFHQVQFEFLATLKDQGLLPVPPDRLEYVLATADDVLNRVAAKQADDLAPAIRRVWDNEIEDIRTDLRGWVLLAASEREWVPTRFEFAFGLKHHTDHRDPSSTSSEAVILDGVRVRGSIDLIERHNRRDVLRITDHKTGKRPENSPVHVGGGAVLQPAIYALAAEQLLNAQVESSRLFYCTQRGDYSECHVPISDEARRRAAQVFTIIDNSLTSGFLPAAPVQGACAICDYQPVCGPYEEQRTRRKPKNRLEDLNILRSLP